jgi:NADH-quinone oxidoreductase subunit H
MYIVLFVLAIILLYAIFVVWAERKVAAFIQDRLGPMEVGPYGMLQTIADLLKLIQKEDIIPTGADRFLFRLAPILIFTAIFAGFATLPLSPEWIGSKADVGVFFMITILSLDVVGIFLLGWASNNKFSILGSFRSIAQIISYELPLTLTILSVVMVSQTLDLQEISYQQGIWFNNTNGINTALLGITSWNIDVNMIGGFVSWNAFKYPFLFLAYIIFFITTLAECNRAPFDIPEGESELVAGFHTEYSGFRFAILFLAEYAMMLLVAFLGVVLFFGSWNTALPNIGSLKLAEMTSGIPGTMNGNVWGFFWLISKALVVVFLQITIRWTYPRLRVDQLMNLCWKVLLPLSLFLVMLSGIWVVWMKL